MKSKKLKTGLIFAISIILVLFIYKGYGNYSNNKKIKESQEKKIEDFRNNLRYSYQLDNKEYKYVETENNISGTINYGSKEVKYNSFSFSSSEEYITTMIDNKIVNIYCEVPISQEEKEFIKSICKNDSLIYVDRTKDKDIAFISTSTTDGMSAYIVDLKWKTTIWSKGYKINGAYYKADSNSVICVTNETPADTIWGKTEYIESEIILDDL